MFMARARSNPLSAMMRWYMNMMFANASKFIIFLISIIFTAPGSAHTNAVSDGLFGMLIVADVAALVGIYTCKQAFEEKSIEKIYRAEIYSVIYGLWLLGLLSYTFVAHALAGLLDGSILRVAYLLVTLLLATFTQTANVYISKVIVERLVNGESPVKPVAAVVMEDTIPGTEQGVEIADNPIRGEKV